MINSNWNYHLNMCNIKHHIIDILYHSLLPFQDHIDPHISLHTSTYLQYNSHMKTHSNIINMQIHIQHIHILIGNTQLDNQINTHYCNKQKDSNNSHMNAHSNSHMSHMEIHILYMWNLYHCNMLMGMLTNIGCCESKGLKMICHMKCSLFELSNMFHTMENILHKLHSDSHTLQLYSLMNMPHCQVHIQWHTLCK